MGCGVYWQQVREVDRALGTMERFGISTEDPAFLALSQKGADLRTQIGVKFPRTTLEMRLMTMLSPGMIRLWHDVESGWMSEGRTRPGAPPVYKSVPDELAMAILKRELTPEQEEFLMTPDPYIGE